MFQYKAQLLSGGYIGHCGTLCSLRLARQVLNQSCEFVLATRAEVPGAGDVCGFSTFDFEIMAMISGRDEQLEPKVQILLPKVFPESIMRLGSVEEATRRFPKPRRGKARWRKSFFSFKVRH
jgi:hypothetical protein